MANLLDGIKVIDWTQAHHGSATGYMLGDLGADVIKVEDPEGDSARTWRSIMGVSLELPGGRNASTRTKASESSSSCRRPTSGQTSS